MVSKRTRRGADAVQPSPEAVSAFSAISAVRSSVLALLAAAGAAHGQTNEKLHFTYLWHLEQPIYWPDQQASGSDRYERAWESIQRLDSGGAPVGHPSNNLRDIFGLPDRVAAYQGRPRDSINALLGAPEAGAQVSFSGGLIENLMSLGGANQLGYSPTWYSGNRQARSWATTGGKPRMDVVIFPFHHALLPLLDDAAVRREIQLYKAVYPDAWGASPGASRGLFPSEMAFSTRLIGALAAEGIDWVFVSGEKVSRACADFPVVFGSGGVNTDPPNRADQMNPAQGAANYYRVSISRGCAPAEAYPFAFTPHRARHVDPQTGAVSTVVVVPCSQSLGWQDGYAPIGLGGFDALQTRNDPARPMLVVLAHDGDNAWGGGYSYYLEATPNLVNSARAAGYVPTVVEQYLTNHPVPANDLVHVEDGAWVNADGDFGAPSFLNWNWPLLNASGQVDIASGWHEDERNWAVITAAQNRVLTAEALSPGGAAGVNLRRVLYPDGTTTSVERAWHYFLGSLNSGYMYYGTAEDFEVKPTIACNEAIQHADAAIAAAGGLGTEATPTTIFLPQRHPWNPGSTNFGPQHGYQQVQSNGDFWVWTFVADASGVADVSLKYRVDGDGQRTLSSTENETYAGGPGVGTWQSLPMTRRAFPAGNAYGNPSINFFEMPAPGGIAEQFSAQVTGIRSTLLDYYVEAVDARGNVKKSPIQHVWVGSGTGGGGGGGGPVVQFAPQSPIAGQNVTVSYLATGRPLAGSAVVNMHYGYNQWNPVVSPDRSMTLNAASGRWETTITLPTTATQLDVVFNNGGTVWDNNGGADWHVAVQGGVPMPTWTMDGTRDADSVLLGTNGSNHLWAGVKGDVLYLATEPPSAGNDAFLLTAQTPGALRTAMWGKAGQVAGWSAFIGAEADNSFAGWTDAGSGVAVQVARGAVLEGTIDLRQQFGTLPASVALAAVRYPTANGGVLLSGTQVPGAVVVNGNVEASEYLVATLCQLDPTRCCPADRNQDGSITPADVAAFVNDWFASLSVGTLAGDFDGSGTVTPADVAAFVTAWSGALAGGC